MLASDPIRPGTIVRGPTLPEPVEVLAIVPLGESLKIIGRGLSTGLTYDPVLSPTQLSQLSVSSDRVPFDGDARLFRLGVEAHRLGLAYEYDPFFSLSIARVDPLPHQLEAVYGYFMKLPRIRFLLADDPGAGKTIMAGLLLKELKARGLVRRVLIVSPANLTFQWQRELTDKFREKFDVIRGDVLRANYGQNPWQERDQVITSVSWVSVVEDARESLLRSRWDLIIVDEAHKMSARSEDHKTYAYRLGENLSKMTDHFLLMTATPHKGDPGCLSLFAPNQGADHRMVSEHLTSEYRVKTSGRGRELDEWKIRTPGADNHWLDCLVGCAVGASMQGAILFGTATKEAPRRQRIKLSEIQGRRA